MTSIYIPIVTETLANGLRVIVSEDRTAPIVAVNLWYHVGSANERTGRTGFAHLFEHMLFQGSANVDANGHIEAVQRAGGTMNGSTWLDRTNYFETVPSNQLELMLWLESDRMAHLLPAMTQAKLDTQRDVVKNERLWTVDNQPYGTWWEQLPAHAFPASHPFHHSLIGSVEDLDAASLDDVREFFATYYTPDNAVLSIVGDVATAEAFALSKRYFGNIPRGRGKPPLGDTTVPMTFGAWRRETVADAVMVPRIFLAFRTPPFNSEGYHASSLCGAVLGMGKGSRLHRNLVNRLELATSASAFTFDLSVGADLLVCDVTAAPGVSVDALERAVVSEIDTLLNEGVSDQELDRARNLITTELVSALQSAQTRADRLSMFATYCGDPRLLNTHADRYLAVTSEQATDVARKTLHNHNRLSLCYVPQAEAHA